MKKIIRIALLSSAFSKISSVHAFESWNCAYGKWGEQNNLIVEVRFKSLDILMINWKDYSGGWDYYKISKNTKEVLLGVKVDGDGLDNPETKFGYIGYFFINKNSGLWVSRTSSLSDGYMDEGRGFCKNKPKIRIKGARTRNADPRSNPPFGK